MKNKLEIMIEHIANNSGMEECDCYLCACQENATFLDGLREALKLIPKRRK